MKLCERCNKPVPIPHRKNKRFCSISCNGKWYKLKTGRTKIRYKWTDEMWNRFINVMQDLRAKERWENLKHGKLDGKMKIERRGIYATK